MVQFKRKQQTPNYLSRGYQRRLLLMVGGLCFVFFLMNYSAKRETWTRFFVGQELPEDTRVDTRARPIPEQAEIPDAVIIQPAPRINPEDADKYFPGVRPEYLSRVKDDTPFWGSEADAFYHLLEILSRTEQEKLNDAGVEDVSFAQIFDQSKDYRGKLVAVEGNVRMANYRKTRRSRDEDGKLTDEPNNSYGIRGYWDLWLKPANQDSPLRAFVLDLPEAFPTTGEPHEDVQITGFYYRRMPYEAKDGVRLTPVLLAKTVSWEAPVVTKDQPPNTPLLATLSLGAVALSLIGVAWIFTRDLRNGRVEEYAQRLRQAEKVDLDEEQVGPGVLESLEGLEQEELAEAKIGPPTEPNNST